MSYMKEIVAKVATLPLEKQRELLDFAEFLASQQESSSAETEGAKKPPFQSVRGMLNNKLGHLDEDLAEIRREMWRKFPRDFPPEELQ